MLISPCLFGYNQPFIVLSYTGEQWIFIWHKPTNKNKTKQKKHISSLPQKDSGLIFASHEPIFTICYLAYKMSPAVVWGLVSLLHVRGPLTAKQLSSLIS